MPKIFEVIDVQVHFYRSFKFSFLLFQTYFQTLPQPKRKDEKIQTNHKIEPQHIHLYSNNTEMEKIRLICILTRFLQFIIGFICFSFNGFCPESYLFKVKDVFLRLGSFHLIPPTVWKCFVRRHYIRMMPFF